MKTQKKTRNHVFLWVAVPVFSLTAFISCGGGGGGSPTNQNQSGHWDTMVWDQGNWQ